MRNIPLAENGVEFDRKLLAAREVGQDKDNDTEENFEDANEELASRSGSVASSRSEVFQDASEVIPVSSL